MNISKIRAGLGLAAALVLLTACAPAPREPQMSEREAEIAAASVLRSLPFRPYFLALEEGFPDDAARMRAEMVEVIRYETDPRVANERGQELGRALRRRHAENLLNAPEAALLTLLDAEIALLRHVESDPERCLDLLLDGPGAAEMANPVFGPLLQARVRALIAASRAGADSTIRREGSRKEDTLRYAAAFGSLGEAHAAFRTMGRITERPEGGCAATLRVLTVLRDNAFEGRDRVLAETMHKVHKS